MRNLIRATVIGAAVALIVAASAVARPETVRLGTLVFRGDGGVFPAKLPKHRQAPIGGWVKVRLSTIDGSHPPAVQRAIIDFDRAFQVNVKGLPVCKEVRLVALSTPLARRACRGSIVGSGEGEVEVAFADQRPFSATGPITLFNGGVHGGTTLLLTHAYVAVPTPTAVITTTKITRVPRDRFGLHTVTEIPEIAGGAGSVTGFRFKIKRTFNYKGKMSSFITASCPTGLFFVRARVQFTGETMMKLGNAIPCTPQD
jgi:hypothetical protein